MNKQNKKVNTNHSPELTISQKQKNILIAISIAIPIIILLTFISIPLIKEAVFNQRAIDYYTQKYGCTTSITRKENVTVGDFEAGTLRKIEDVRMDTSDGSTILWLSATDQFIDNKQSDEIDQGLRNYLNTLMTELTQAFQNVDPESTVDISPSIDDIEVVKIPSSETDSRRIPHSYYTSTYYDGNIENFIKNNQISVIKYNDSRPLTTNVDLVIYTSAQSPWKDLMSPYDDIFSRLGINVYVYDRDTACGTHWHRDGEYSCMLYNDTYQLNK